MAISPNSSGLTSSLNVIPSHLLTPQTLLSCPFWLDSIDLDLHSNSRLISMKRILVSRTLHQQKSLNKLKLFKTAETLKLALSIQSSPMVNMNMGKNRKIKVFQLSLIISLLHNFWWFLINDKQIACFGS